MSGMPIAWPAWFTQPSMSSTRFRKMAEVPTRAKSCEHALMTALTDSSWLSFESMKSTTTLRPASPPWALVYFAQPFTPSTEPWNRPGDSGVSTSATTAMRIVVGVTPTSLAVFAVVVVAAEATDATPLVAARAQATVMTTAIQRTCFTWSPRDSERVLET